MNVVGDGVILTVKGYASRSLTKVEAF
ncbi:MAG: hypothetical protein RUDDFDWM_001719, partial [Candidatus Fervidibacterota bacterium]